jgi:hypothetical protein
LSQQEYAALNSFFSAFLFKEGGAYTLFGEKPITFDVLIPSDHEEKCEGNDQFWENGWKKIRGKMKTPLFILTERPSPFNELRAVFLVNIAATAITLKKHYTEFREFVGFEFDPLLTVFEIENESSQFWSKVLSDTHLLGILLGYGDANAYLHQYWIKAQNKGAASEKIRDFLTVIRDQAPTSNSGAKTKDDILFHLPIFACHSRTESASLLKKYKKDRARIRHLYKGKDLVEVSLKRLTSKDLPADPNQEYKKLYSKTYNTTEMEEYKMAEISVIQTEN